VDVTTGLEYEANNSSIRIFVRLFGGNGDSGRRLLHKSTNNTSCFLPGQTDSFLLEAVLLGDLLKLVISHTTTTPGQFNGYRLVLIEMMTFITLALLL